VKVKMRTLAAGPDGVRPAGSVIDVTGAEGQSLIDGGYAEALNKVVETATVSAPENQDLLDKLEKMRGGYYKLPNGEKVHGKRKALEVLSDMEAESVEEPAEPEDAEGE